MPFWFKRCRQGPCTLSPSVWSHVRLLVGLSVAVFLVLPMLCHNMPQSVFYKLFNSKSAAKAMLLEQNEGRISEARDILDELSRRNSTSERGRSPETRRRQTRVVVTILTVSRENLQSKDTYSPKYLTQVVAKFLHLLDMYYHQHPEPLLDIAFSVCNIDAGVHAEADQLKRLANVHQMPRGVTQLGLHVAEKAKRSYVYCLNRTLQDRPDFVLVVEDDALPKTNLLPVMERTISRAVDGHSRFLDTVFIKYYHPERLLGFLALDPERLPELFALSAILASCLWGVWYWVRVRDRPSLPEHRIALWAGLFLLSAGACLCIGRTNLIKFHQLFSPQLYYTTPAPSCCTQAVLYPVHSVRPIVAYLQGVTCGRNFAIDHALDKYMGEPGRKAYLVQPNLFTHIGLYSAAHRKNGVDPYLIVA